MDKAIIITVFVIIAIALLFVANNTPIKPESIDTSLPEISLSTTPGPSPTQIPADAININQPTESATFEAQNTTIQNSAIIKTSKGDIELTLYPDEAPNTVKNFIEKAKSGFYENLIFHRVEDWVIQGGDPSGNGTGGGSMPTELNNKPFVAGSLGVARGQDIRISNDAQFFITKTEASWLNSQYTNFGIVSEGIDVVNNIEIGDEILNIVIE